MKKIILTGAVLISAVILSSFTLKSEEGKQVDPWERCTTTTCGTEHCRFANSGQAHYDIAMEDEWLDCNNDIPFIDF